MLVDHCNDFRHMGRQKRALLPNTTDSKWVTIGIAACWLLTVLLVTIYKPLPVAYHYGRGAQLRPDVFRNSPVRKQHLKLQSEMKDTTQFSYVWTCCSPAH